VYDLPDGPSAGTIGSIELLFGESFDGLAKFCRCFCDLPDKVLPAHVAEFRFWLEFSDGIPEICHT
jgi:hypothetical protein